MSTKKLVFPFSKAEPTPTPVDPVTELSVDAEAGREAFSYVLRSGRTGTVHVEQVLEYNQDPTYQSKFQACAFIRLRSRS
jgi:hypothetical protein